LNTDPETWPAIAPIGRPIENTQVYILDDSRQLTPIGVPGELYISGACVARGYLNRPELTAERFISHSFGRDTGARLYRTGDRARWRIDGTLEFLGRIDRQIKIRGHRVELGEVEAVISEHQSIAQCAVVSHQEQGGETRLVAYCVRAKSDSAD